MQTHKYFSCSSSSSSSSIVCLFTVRTKSYSILYKQAKFNTKKKEHRKTEDGRHFAEVRLNNPSLLSFHYYST